MESRKKNTANAVILGDLALLLIVVAGAFWMGDAARRDTDKAVRAVSLLYLDELAGRREQVVSSNLQ